MATTTKDRELISADFLARLEQLDIVSRKIFAGRMKGERKSKRKGESVEFADYRSYVVGDDLRFLDWNIYGRLERLFIKLFQAEEDLHVTILLDLSKSMDWGSPAKGLYAKQVTAALAYIGLVNFDRVSVYTYDASLREELAGLRTRRMMHHLIRFLQESEIEGTSNFAATCKTFGLRASKHGVLLILSDFFDKGGFETGMKYLLAKHRDIYAIQILSPEEVDPTLMGDLRLIDIEDGDAAEVTVSRPLINRYKQNLEAYCQSIRDYCSKRGVNYMLTSTDVDFEQLVLNYMRRRGLVR
jgi:uncharacterized protein (DUF58 family)